MPKKVFDAPRHTGLGIVRAEKHSTHSRKHNRAGALGTGFERDVECRVVQTVVFECREGPLNGDEFGMLSEIAASDSLVVGTAHYFTVDHYRRTNRHFSNRVSRSCFL